MKLIPVFTEQSLKEAKVGNYTFWVETKAAKPEIKNAIETAFGVHVTRVRTLNLKKEIKVDFRGHKKVKPARKKAIVTLKKDEKIDLFEEKKEK